MRLYLHYLRIAWTALCAIIAVLLVLLWVRSYWWVDSLNLGLSGAAIGFQSNNGELCLSLHSDPGYLPETGLNSVSAEDFVRGPAVTFFGFGVANWDKLGKDFLFPHWFLILTLASLGILPWLPLKRFSLRTLLIATTLIAALLGLAVWSLR
jgi:hypothetical protein